MKGPDEKGRLCHVSATHGRCERLKQLWNGRFAWVNVCKICGYKWKESDA